MSEAFTGHPPYYNIPHDHILAIKFVKDTKPYNRPTAKELGNMLNDFFYYFNNEETELYKLVKEIKILGKTPQCIIKSNRQELMIRHP
ncbi:hypothetical protein C2G38_2174616 [Gigaspora rosea]|uniref:Protein kinase domain-containing protein n=1 Tax=Gigaspora rosea TaxID=44941 RepID=A0A397VIA4_9GLOM|nr:hypothetical protein C2G38_2174616 [Gigaspora rosea]